MGYKKSLAIQIVLSILLYTVMWYTYQMTYLIGNKEVGIERGPETFKLVESGFHWKEAFVNEIYVYKKEITIRFKEDENGTVQQIN